MTSMPRVKIKRLYACAVKAIAATNQYQVSFRVVTSYVCMTRVPYAPIDIYDLWKQNGINKSSIFWKY